MTHFRVEKPFATSRQLHLFAALIAVLLILPAMRASIWPSTPATVYQTVPPRYLNYRFIGDEMAAARPVDVLAIGASDVWTAVDITTLQAELSRLLGRPARVLNFGTNWFGAEVYYARVVDALRTLKPKVVVVADIDAGFAFPHELTKFVWRNDLPLPQGLSLVERATLYGAAVLGTPHRLWADLRPASRAMTPTWNSSAEAMAKTSGFNGEKQGWLSHFDPDRNNRRKYLDANHQPPNVPVADLFYKGIEDRNFKHLHYTYNGYQTAFLRGMHDATRAAGAIFATMSIPTHFNKAPNTHAIVRLLDNNVVKPWPHFGVSMTRMFEGLNYDQMVDYYSNESHLSAAGARIFMRSVAPAFAKLVTDAEQGK